MFITPMIRRTLPIFRSPRAPAGLRHWPSLWIWIFRKMETDRMWSFRDWLLARSIAFPRAIHGAHVLRTVFLVQGSVLFHGFHILPLSVQSEADGPWLIPTLRLSGIMLLWRRMCVLSCGHSFPFSRAGPSGWHHRGKQDESACSCLRSCGSVSYHDHSVFQHHHGVWGSPRHQCLPWPVFPTTAVLGV